MEEDEVDFIIKKFFGNQNSVENEVVHEKRKRIRHVHWWDGWENKPKSEPEEDFEALNLQLSAILDCIGDANCKRGIMEELRKRAIIDKTGKSVKDLVLTFFEMASLASGFSLNERINFASRVYKMLHAKLLIEEEERANEMSVVKKDEEAKSFDMSENEDSDDLLLRIANVEAEWNALIGVSFVEEGEGTIECEENSVAELMTEIKNDNMSILANNGKTNKGDNSLKGEIVIIHPAGLESMNVDSLPQTLMFESSKNHFMPVADMKEPRSYQGASLMRKYGVNVPKGVAVFSVSEVKQVINDTFLGETDVVIKSPGLLGKSIDLCHLF